MSKWKDMNTWREILDEYNPYELFNEDEDDLLDYEEKWIDDKDSKGIVLTTDENGKLHSIKVIDKDVDKWFSIKLVVGFALLCVVAYLLTYFIFN